MSKPPLYETSSSERLSGDIEWLCPSLDNRPFDLMLAYGMASWLWGQSSLHRGWTVGLQGATIWPALTHRQFLLGRDSQMRPVAYVSWAQLDEQGERKYLQTPNALTMDDWHSGDRIWFIDWITPFGGARSVARKIECDIFPDRAGHSLHVKEGRDTARIYDHFGKNVSQTEKQRSVEQLRRNLANAFGSKQQNIDA